MPHSRSRTSRRRSRRSPRRYRGSRSRRDNDPLTPEEVGNLVSDTFHSTGNVISEMHAQDTARCHFIRLKSINSAHNGFYLMVQVPHNIMEEFHTGEKRVVQGFITESFPSATLSTHFEDFMIQVREFTAETLKQLNYLLEKIANHAENDTTAVFQKAEMSRNWVGTDVPCYCVASKKLMERSSTNALSKFAQLNKDMSEHRKSVALRRQNTVG